MARGNGTANAEGAVNEAGTGEDADKKRGSRSYIVVPLPPDLKSRFESEAEAADLPAGPYVRNLLAKLLGIELPPAAITARRSKYASDEERKAAQKQRNQNRSATMRDLFALFKAAQASGLSPEEAAQRAAQGMLEKGSTPTEGEPVTA